jgi:tryptophan synthase alpha subunit
MLTSLHAESQLRVPIVIFTYLNPILSFGFERFVEHAQRAGVGGLLIVDLPPEEAQPYCAAASKSGMEMIFLASPTTTPSRLRLIDEFSSGFVYFISRLGVTGIRPELSDSLRDEVLRAREAVRKPLAIGFGISSPEQARVVGSMADGVVIGSKLVSLIEAAPSVEQAKVDLAEFARAIKAALLNV